MDLVYDIYCDGAYSPMRDQGGIGIVFIKDGKQIGQYGQTYKNTTNNRMELQAIITTLLSFKNKVNSITIHSDSQYVIGTILKGWKRNKNQDLWEKFDKAQEYVIKNICSEIKYEWVKGHADNEFNEQADKIANKASQLL
jgi:ribonuclease HI